MKNREKTIRTYKYDDIDFDQHQLSQSVKVEDCLFSMEMVVLVFACGRGGVFDWNFDKIFFLERIVWELMV